MQIFVSYASEDRDLAEQVRLALAGADHKVFFDRDNLPAGADYHDRIRAAVRQSDLFVFLVSPRSIASGSYALTELKYARAKWDHPKNKVIPVIAEKVPWEAIPEFLKAVTVLEPEGNMAAEVLLAVAEIASKKRWMTAAVVAILLLVVGALGVAAIANWIGGNGVGRVPASQVPAATVAKEFKSANGGRWRAEDGRWVEYSPAGVASFYFEEFKRDSDFIYLVDSSRTRPGDPNNPTILRLPIAGGTAQWSFQNPIVWIDLAIVYAVRQETTAR